MTDNNKSDLQKKADLRLSCLPTAFNEIQLPQIFLEGDAADKLKILYKRAFFNTLNGIKVLFSIELHGNGLTWLHVSTSHTERYPGWEELKFVKECFLGDVWAYQCFPPKAHHVNISQNCFHLWHCPDRDLFCEGDYKGFGQ